MEVFFPTTSCQCATEFILEHNRVEEAELESKRLQIVDKIELLFDKMFEAALMPLRSIIPIRKSR